MPIDYYISSKIFQRMASHRVFMPLFLLFLGLLAFCTYDVKVSSDMGLYMNSALNIYLGKGYTDMDSASIFHRPPLFSLMIAAGYWVLGVSVWSAFWVVRFFCIFNPIVIYFLGKRFFGKWVGFSAAILVLSSYSLGHWSYRHLDAVVPFFVLVSLWFGVVGLEERRLCFLSFSGFIMGLSFLVKEVAVLFFILPLLIFLIVREFRCVANFRGVIFYFVTLALTVFPWILYVYYNSSSLSLLGLGGPMVIEGLLEQSPGIQGEGVAFLVERMLGIGRGIVYYYKNSLTTNFFIAPLFVFAWAFAIFRAFRRDKYNIILCICTACYLPIICFLGENQWRLGQGIIFFLLSYLAIANFLWSFATYIASKFISLKDYILANRYKIWFSLLVILLVVCIQILAEYKEDKGFSSFFKRSLAYQQIFKGNKQRETNPRYGKVAQETAGWIKNNIPEGSRLMMSKSSEAKPIYFYSMADYPIFVMPVIHSNNIEKVFDRSHKDSVIFISSWSSKVVPVNTIYALFEDELVKAIQDNRIDYIIVAKKRNYLSLYFDSGNGFKKIREFGGGEIKIYKVNEANKLEGFNPLVSKQARKYIGLLRKDEPLRYENLKQTFFKGVLGFNEKEIIGVETGDYGTTIKSYKVY